MGDQKRQRRGNRQKRGVKRQKCGAKNRSTGTNKTCKNYAVEGGKRCRLHGGRPPSREIRPQTRTGANSAHYRALGAEGQARLAELERDPELLDVRGPAALSHYLIEQMPLDPDPDQIWELARHVRARREDMGPDELPTRVAEALGELEAFAADLGDTAAEQIAAVEVLRVWAAEVSPTQRPSPVDVWEAWVRLQAGTQKQVALHARVITNAYAKSRAGELMMAGLAPYMARLVISIRAVLDSRLRAHPELQREIMKDVGDAFAAVSAQVMAD